MAIYRLNIALSWSNVSGSPGVNVWHFRTTELGETGRSQLEAFSSALQEFYTNIQSYFGTDYRIQFDGIAVEEVHGSGDPDVVDGMTSWSVSGTGTGAYLPPANALLLSMRGSSVGRKQRGRKFLGPVMRTTAEDNGTPQEGVRSSLVTFFGELLDHFDGPTNGAPALYSRGDGSARDIVAGSAPNEFAVLRSRRD